MSARSWYPQGLSAVGCVVAVLLLGLTAGPAPAASDSGKRPVAILQDDLPVAGAASRPEVLAESLRRAGYQVALLDAAAIADPQRLNAEKFATLVLPYGATFPAEAVESFRAFLRAGGSFLSTGGYAFDYPVAPQGGALGGGRRGTAGGAGVAQ